MDSRFLGWWLNSGVLATFEREPLSTIYFIQNFLLDECAAAWLLARRLIHVLSVGSFLLSDTYQSNTLRCSDVGILRRKHRVNYAEKFDSS
jgi:hypothetical protein